MKKVIIIGAGFGGLAAGAELARSGLDVTVLEAHIYQGRCAGTFYTIFTPSAQKETL